jgi:signal transduction histidine kinase/PAS domain-containing protein
MSERKAPSPAAMIRAWVDRARSARSAISEGDDRPSGEEMGTNLEELRVAEEELRVQGVALQEALDQVERQRRRFEELFRHAPIAYLITDMDGRIQDANDAASALLQVPFARITDKPLAAYFRSAGELRDQLARLARFESIENWDTRLIPLSGRPIPVRIAATAAQATASGQIEVRWVLRDVRPERASRDRQRHLHREQAARAALEQVAERARFLSDASARLMGLLNADAVWQIASELAESHAAGVVVLERPDADPDRLEVRATGGNRAMRTRLEPLRGQVIDLGSEGPVAGVLPLEPVRAALRHGEPEVVPAGGDEPDDHAGLLVVPIVAGSRTVGLIAAWLPPGRRLGEEVLMQRTLAERVGLALEAATLFEEVVRARRRAEEATAAESDFLAMVSHELRTPLTAIISYSELLEDRSSEMPPKLARYAHQIAGAAKHQRQLVEQILSYKQVQREDAGAAEPEELDFRDVAQFAVAMVRPQVEGKPVEVMAELPPVPVPGVCDPGKLRQILANLLSNAIRHTEAGHVRLSLSTDDPYVVMTVEDTGEGIGAEALPRIFDRFWRGAGMGEASRGSGLGLTITRELVTRMSGEIGVESEPGKGTTFTVRIPRVAVQGQNRRGDPPAGGEWRGLADRDRQP